MLDLEEIVDALALAAIATPIVTSGIFYLIGKMHIFGLRDGKSGFRFAWEMFHKIDIKDLPKAFVCSEYEYRKINEKYNLILKKYI